MSSSWKASAQAPALIHTQTFDTRSGGMVLSVPLKSLQKEDWNWEVNCRPPASDATTAGLGVSSLKTYIRLVPKAATGKLKMVQTNVSSV